MSDIDNSAVVRICGIAKGTPSPFATMLRAMVLVVGKPDSTEWPDLIDSLSTIYHARDTDEAREAVDAAHEALQGLREYDYDGIHADDDY